MLEIQDKNFKIVEFFQYMLSKRIDWQRKHDIFILDKGRFETHKYSKLNNKNWARNEAYNWLNKEYTIMSIIFATETALNILLLAVDAAEFYCYLICDIKNSIGYFASLFFY